MFKLRNAVATVELELTEKEIAVDVVPPASLLDRSRAVIAKSLERFRNDQAALETGIAEMTEKLRQTRVAIDAFTAAERTLVEGVREPPPAEREAPMVERR